MGKRIFGWMEKFRRDFNSMYKVCLGIWVLYIADFFLTYVWFFSGYMQYEGNPIMVFVLNNVPYLGFVFHLIMPYILMISLYKVNVYFKGQKMTTMINMFIVIIFVLLAIVNLKHIHIIMMVI